jgi:hypothetical protein
VSTTTETAEITDEEEQEEEEFALAQPYAVPSDSAFQGKEFILQPADLVTMARDLIDSCEEFSDLRAASIEWAWKRKGGMSNGGVQQSGHKRSDVHAVSHGAKEFLAWLAADHARETPWTEEEVEIAGAGMLRIDIPGEPPATQFYSPAALYALTPTTEEVARAVALRSRPEPVQRWELPERIVALPREEDEYDPMRDADDDDDPGF